jgi:hypothetical protein
MEPYVTGKSIVGDDGKLCEPVSCSTPNNLTVLAHWFARLNPKTTLETGLGYAGSATLLCELHQRAGGEGRRHHAIDPYQKEWWSNAGLRHLESSGLSQVFEHHNSLSSRALPKMFEAGMRFGLIYVDGSHLFEEVFVDFYYAQQMLETGGIIAFDDSSCGHVRKVLGFIRSNLKESLTEHSPYTVTSPTNARLKQFAARLLNRQQLTLFMKTGNSVRNWSTPFHGF